MATYDEKVNPGGGRAGSQGGSQHGAAMQGDVGRDKGMRPLHADASETVYTGGGLGVTTH